MRRCRRGGPGGPPRFVLRGRLASSCRRLADGGDGLVLLKGQWVELDETVANVETDKVTVEIKSPTAGVITKFHVKQGDNLGVGKPLFDVDPDAAKPAGSPAPAKAETKTDAPKPVEAKTEAVKEAVK